MTTTPADATDPVDAETIQATFKAGLDVFVSCPATRSELLTLRDALCSHIDLLSVEVQGLAPRMRGTAREIAVHVLRGARQLLAEVDGLEPGGEGLDDEPTQREQEVVYDMAVYSRCLLSAFAMRGPLGDPIGADEIAEKVGRRVCGACWQPIAEDEPVELKVFASEAGGGIRGVVHAELCEPRQPELIGVPTQPTPA